MQTLFFILAVMLLVLSSVKVYSLMLSVTYTPIAFLGSFVFLIAIANVDPKMEYKAACIACYYTFLEICLYLKNKAYKECISFIVMFLVGLGVVTTLFMQLVPLLVGTL